MKRIIFAAICITLLASCNKGNRIVVNTEKTPSFENINDSLSWALGFSVAQNVAATDVDINREIFMQAIFATLDQKQQPFTQETTTAMLMDLEQRASIKRMSNQNNQMEETRQREAVYFAKLQQENPNVKKSDKGFYYEVIKQGNGPVAEIGSIVVFDYKGSLTNGHIFDQTYGNREPITHVIGNEMMPGLLEGFLMMPSGSTYRFYIPNEMAFGAQGTVDIPPYATVIYEVELHDVHK